MGEKTIQNLVETRKRILEDVEQGKLGVEAAARMLGITRQGLWKLRKNVREYGEKAIVGRKRGPRSYHPHQKEKMRPCTLWQEGASPHQRS